MHDAYQMLRRSVARVPPATRRNAAHERRNPRRGILASGRTSGCLNTIQEQSPWYVAGANLEARDPDGWTPLMFAARDNANPDVARGAGLRAGLGRRAGPLPPRLTAVSRWGLTEPSPRSADIDAKRIPRASPINAALHRRRCDERTRRRAGLGLGCGHRSRLRAHARVLRAWPPCGAAKRDSPAPYEGVTPPSPRRTS